MRLKTAAKALALSTAVGGLFVIAVSSAQAGYGFSASGVLLQPDGNIVAVGSGTYSSRVNSRFALARYEPNGTLDSGFGMRGRVLTSLGASSGSVSAAVLQPDGKAVAAGSSSAGPTVKFALARYEPDGSLDTTFGTDGTVTTAIGPSTDYANAVALQPDGKIVLAGQSRRVARPAPSGFDFALARYNPDGSLDQSFGTGGKVVTRFGDSSGALGDSSSSSAVVVQPDGKIVAAGSDSGRFAVVRYLPDGTLDPSFGANGKVTTGLGGTGAAANAMTLQPDGKILVAGIAENEALQDRFALARYEPDGSLDASFGTGGIVTTAISEHASASSLVLQPDGRIVAAGTECGAVCENDRAFALARYKPDGSLDPTFGSAGIVTTAIGVHSSGADGLALQSDGKIIAAGYSGFTSSCACGNVFALARYDANGALDPGFGSGGKVTTSFICVVPSTKGKLLEKAKRMIVRGRCSVGQVKKSFSRKIKKGRIISERPTRGSKRFAGAKVNLVVSKGRRRHR